MGEKNNLYKEKTDYVTRIPAKNSNSSKLPSLETCHCSDYGHLWIRGTFWAPLMTRGGPGQMKAWIVKPPAALPAEPQPPRGDKETCHPVLILESANCSFFGQQCSSVSQRKEILTDRLRVVKWTTVIMSSTSEFRCQPWHLLSQHQHRNLPGGIPPEQPAEYSGHCSHCSCSQMRWIQVKTQFAFKLNNN